MKARVYCKWGLDVPTEFENAVNIYVDRRKDTPKSPGEFDVLYLCEPHTILPKMSDYARKHPHTFDLIVASTDRLEGRPKVVHLEFGTSWIRQGGLPQKVEGISMVVGAKSVTDGHALRHEIWRRQGEIRQRKSFYVSKHGGPSAPAWPQLGDDKTAMFDCMFHIAIENTRCKYYFTEKLVDCLVTKTVPIYWGCTNIADYFDTRGLLLAASADQIVSTCNSATPEAYERMKPYIEDNFRRAQQFIHLGDRLGRKIKQYVA